MDEREQACLDIIQFVDNTCGFKTGKTSSIPCRYKISEGHIKCLCAWYFVYGDCMNENLDPYWNDMVLCLKAHDKLVWEGLQVIYPR